MSVHFSDHFGVDKRLLDEYGAFNISLITDLPLFVDPFLLFNSQKPEYRELHEQIITYLRFLRDRAEAGGVSAGLIRAWYRFPEVRQNWFGFTAGGNRGRGLGKDFAHALHGNLNRLFGDFGREEITRSSHLEKLCLINDGVGRDNISDFTTNLIKGFLCEYTQIFAQRYIREDLRRRVPVRRVRFKYETASWETGSFDLPWFADNFVLLTPKDMLTRDDTWINRTDLLNDFEEIPQALPNDELREQINYYFLSQLPRRRRKEPSAKERREAAARTIWEFPVLIDAFIRLKEDRGDEAEDISNQRVEFSERLYIQQLGSLQEILHTQTGFYALRGNTYDEAQNRVAFLKDVIENKGGHRLFYVGGRPIEREADVQIMYRLCWYGTPSDVSREVNDGRGPADFKVSRGGSDKTIVEFKLAKNSKLENNLRKQTGVYQAASDARHSIKVILYFTGAELRRVQTILQRLRLEDSRDVVLIDARDDNKPSGSRA